MTITPVFLISLPRSGSTLLQRLLANHPTISTAPEPWILLPLLSVDRPESSEADYEFEVSRRALEDFWTLLPHGRTDYIQAVGEMVSHLYELVSPAHATHFVDKTPRYHLVLDDIAAAFPDARFLILWRNPLSTMSSMLDVDGHWNLYRYEIDLLDGWSNIDAFKSKAPERCMGLRYEDLVMDPTGQMGNVWDFLGLESAEVRLDKEDRVLTGRMGDKGGSLGYDTVSRSSLSSWKQVLDSRARRDWAQRCLMTIGPERLSRAGYDPTNSREK